MVALTDSTFLKEVSKRELFVVDFWTYWCGPCK
ncbi:MAG: hypothetical protein JRN20_04940 [Nitrososphaerota archaeon]|nr:hypothetical protein [Nitrososphaerota archaeon]MDG6923178.1 hypothetical protein [Nitrososphaerota archaeon]